MSSKITKTLEEKYKYNKVVWKDTYRIAEQFPHKNAEKINKFNDIEFEKKIDEREKPDKKIIKVFNEDLIVLVDSVVKAGFRPLILVNANDNYPLKSVKNGLISTECDLYRCSNISMVTTDTMYPIRDLDMLYCPKVTIFKTLDNKLLKKPYQIALVLSAPVRRPTLISIKTDQKMEDSYSNISEENKMRSKIENIFKLAVDKGYKCLILTDFGCQNESNPIKKIIEFFNECIKKYPIKYVFFYVKSSEDMFENKTKSSKKVKDKNFEIFHACIKRKI
jgi:hypothetical protein